MKRNLDVERFVARLREVPFVRKVRLAGQDKSATLTVESLQASQVFTYAVTRSNLTKSEADVWAGRVRTKQLKQPFLLMTPYVSEPMGARLREAGIQYVDAVGNASLSIEGANGPQHVALIQGHVPPRALAAERAWRAASHQVLFTLLVRPSLLRSPVREVATRAEVSTSPVLQVRDKLVQMGMAVEAGRQLRWTPGGIENARAFWLRGYQTTLRPQLMIQRFRARPGMGVPDIEAEIEARLERELSWRWGGAAAAWRLDSYYRGDVTVVHVHAPQLSAHELGARLRMLPDPKGPIVFMQRPGAVAFDRGAARVVLPALEEQPKPAIVHTLQPATVHPLLAWAELLEEGHDRAAEAAAELAAHFLDGNHDA
jgi:hypothetical protein